MDRDSLGTATRASSRLRSPLLRYDRRAVLPVRGEAVSTFSIKMENAALFAGCLLLSHVENLQIVSNPCSYILTTHRSVI